MPYTTRKSDRRKRSIMRIWRRSSPISIINERMKEATFKRTLFSSTTTMGDIHYSNRIIRKFGRGVSALIGVFALYG